MKEKEWLVFQLSELLAKVEPGAVRLHEFLRIQDEDHPVEKGTLMYVRAASEHAFFDVEEDLTVLAFFGTAARGLA